MSSSPAPGIGLNATSSPPAGYVPHRIAPLTAEYRKAHKNYVLVAALLASWELIGINLNTKEKWGIELASPKAVPLILFTLLVYSAYKVLIEWEQCDADRRKTGPAKIDFYVGHLIALAAVLIGLVQYLLRVRIVDILTNDFSKNVQSTAFGSMMTTLLAVQLISKWKQHSNAVTRFTVVSLLIFIGITLKFGVFALGTQHRRGAVYAVVVGFLLGGLSAIYTRKHDLMRIFVEDFSDRKAQQSTA